jgi:xylose isomerase
MKYSVILGNLGNTRDRFLSTGYKEEQATDAMLRQAVSIPGVKGIELVGNWDVSEKNAKAMKKLLGDNGVALVGIIPEHFSQKLWAKGAFTSRDPGVRRRAVEHTKEMIDILLELGGSIINLWPGQDGYDYILQGNFDEAYAWLVEGIREIADYRPGVRIALEFKPKEPRNFCYMARSSDTLLTALETGRENVGVTIDTGHALMGGENLAEAAFRLMKAGKLFHLHLNDNHQGWDDDMIVGSVHTLQYVELFFWLRKTGYDGWWSLDQYPYREDGREALAQSIAWIDALVAKMEARGLDALEKAMRRGEATEITGELRRMLLG